MAFADCVHYTLPQGRTRTLLPGSSAHRARVSRREGRDYADAEEMSTMLEEHDAHPRMERDGLLLRDKLFASSASFYEYLFRAPTQTKYDAGHGREPARERGGTGRVGGAAK